MTADDRTLGEEIIDWIEATCRVPEGALIGQPIRLMQWLPTFPPTRPARYVRSIYTIDWKNKNDKLDC